MSNELNHDGSITVTAYSLHEFAFELCDLAAKGFTVTLENSKVPTGGIGSYYSATLVPRHSYRIDLEGNHLNVPEDIKEAKSEGVEKEATDVAETKETPKTAPKTTRTTKK